MHLVDILKLRQVTLSGIYICLTRRCPLSCEHCSTNSNPFSNEFPDPSYLERFVDSFEETKPPQILCLTGGEPLILPELVNKLANKAHSVGTKVMSMTGLYFANSKKMTSSLLNAIQNLDHLSISVDYFHEKQLGRLSIFETIHKIREAGTDMSISIVGMNENDPYLGDLVNSIRDEFNSEIPMLVSFISSTGRAKQLETAHKEDNNIQGIAYNGGCRYITWPVISFDGSIVACCNQKVVDGPHPSHLTLGHVSNTNWKQVSEKVINNSIIKAIRIVGPKEFLKYVGKEDPCNGYCDSCMSINKTTDVKSIHSWVNKPSMKLIETFLEENVDLFLFDKVISPFSNLINLGQKIC